MTLFIVYGLMCGERVNPQKVHYRFVVFSPLFNTTLFRYHVYGLHHRLIDTVGFSVFIACLVRV